MRVRIAAESLSAGAAAALVNVCIICAITGVAVTEFKISQTAVLVACLIVGLAIAWWDGWQTGFFLSLILCAVCAPAISAGNLVDHPSFVVLAAILGAILHRFPRSLGLSSLAVLVLVSVFHWRFLVEFGLPLVGVAAASFGLRRVLQRLTFSFQEASAMARPRSVIAAFAIGYILIAGFFALLYTTLDYSTPRGSFKVSLPDAPLPRSHDGADLSTSDREKLSLPLSSYFSLLTISSSGCNEVTPRTNIARFAMCLEVVTGMLWFTVYLALLLKSLGS
ncbi:MAG: ion channel [Terriglobales bacterium]